MIGLTTGICLAESGLRTGIRTAAPPEATTSAVAGAVWGPVMAGPAGRCREWARTDLETLRELEQIPGTGVRSVAGRELSREPEEPPHWIDLLDDVRLCRDDDLPPGFVSGLRYTALLGTHAGYLQSCGPVSRARAGEIHVIGSHRSDVARHPPVVINCTGVAARHLVPDPAVTPVAARSSGLPTRGSGVLHRPQPLEPGRDLSLPMQNAVVLGGTVAGRLGHHAAAEIAERSCGTARPLSTRGSSAPRVPRTRRWARPLPLEVGWQAEPLEGGGGCRGTATMATAAAASPSALGCAWEITAAVLGRLRCSGEEKPVRRPLGPARSW